jgi:hypothetical protein
MSHRDTENAEIVKENVFNFENPENVSCSVWNYTHSHSWLQIKAYSFELKQDFLIHFNDVHYFSGAIGWLGANFRLHSRNQCIKLLTKHNPSFIEVVNMLTTDDLMNRFFHWRLYSIPTSTGNIIQIIADEGGVTIYKD